MDIQEILNVIEHALVSAPGSFEAAANAPVYERGRSGKYPLYI